MPIGEGKYDAHVTRVREEEDAAAVILIVLRGKRGHGYSVQTTDPGVSKVMPALLHNIADELEMQRKRGEL